MASVIEQWVRKSKPENLTYGTVLNVDVGSERLFVRCKGNIDQYIIYSPDEFPNITEGDVVTIGIFKSHKFLISRVPSGIPKTSVILDV